MTSRDRVILAFGSYELDTATHELHREGRLVRVAPQAVRLLLALTATPAEVVSRQTLRRTLWPDDTYVDFERSLNSAMRKLRAALNDTAEAARYIQTLHGRGYRFIAPVRRIAMSRDAEVHRDPQPVELVRVLESQPHAVSMTDRGGRWPRVQSLIAMTCVVATCIAVVVLITPSLWGVTVPAAGDARTMAAYRRGQATGDQRITDLNRAIGWFGRAVELDATFAPAWAGIARARATRAMVDGRGESELRQARDEAQRALRIDGGLADAHIAAGQVQLALDKDPVAAEISFRTAVALGADAGRHRVWLAWALHEGHDNAGALRVVDDVLAREPQNATFHAWRGMLLHTVQRYDDELEELQRASSMDDDSWQVALHLGLGYSRRGAFDRALPALKRAVDLSDAGGLPLLWLGRTAADAGDVATAEQVAQQLRDGARARGVTQSFADSVESHIASQRRKAKRGFGA